AVGLTGFSYGGMRALMMGVGSAANPQFDARVDAIAPVAGGMNWDKVPALSSDGAATPAWRPRATTSAPVWWGHQGWMTHTDEAVMNTALTAERAEFADEAVPSSNGNGSMTAGSALLTISGSPAFTAGDVGSRVNVAGAGASGRTLWTSIALYTSPTEVTLATTASTPVSGARASWGPRGFWDERLFLSGDAVVDKAAHIAVPTLLVHGWLDGTIGTAYAEVYGEIYNRIPGNDRYLYLGSCTHSGSGLSGDPCHQTTNGPRMRDTLHRFFDRYVRGETTNAVRPPGTTTCATTGPCVIYTIPAKWVSSTNNPWYTDNWTEVSRTSWPPSDFTPETRYFRNDGTLSTTWETTPQANTSCSALPPTKGTGCSTFTNDLNVAPTFDVCYGLTYGTTEVQSFDWSFAAEKKVARLEADLHLSSTTSRQQVYVDVWLTDSAGTELTRVWQGSTQIAPVKRDGTPGTVYRFKFRPGTAAWTVAAGQRLRIKVASGYARGLPSEPLPATYTLYHNDPYRSAITLTYVP
ncbi:MAG TPA: CocE/NonD family hydrolase C-terminal non-catalytic domain-containing protein, partial [Acidimicrobiales bacterium]|nr:CocE/NonD family hydrolase C-terminal non-catalytic domain-containing protein [Acidimicrobiales bacterium]